MTWTMKRLLRTVASERFAILVGGQDAAVLDIHYLASGSVDATVILVEGAGFTEANVPALLSEIDDMLLPHVSTDEGNLSFSVVVGRVLGAFTGSAAEPSQALSAG